MKIPSLLLVAFLGTTALLPASLLNNPLQDVPRSMLQTQSLYPGGEKQMTCTAFVVDASKGLALTAEHCVVDGQILLMADGEQSEVVKKSEWLALIKVKPMSRPPLDIAASAPKLHDLTWGFGWAFGKVFLVLERAVAGIDGTDLVVGGAYIEGMSGGPVLNAKGQVVGVIQGGVPAAAWMSGVVEIREFLKN